MNVREVTGSDLRKWVSPARPYVWVAVAAAVALTVHVVILLALRRGFDWSDESWSYSLIANSRVTEGEAWGYQYLLHGPFEWLGKSVLAFRVVRFLGYGAFTVVATTVLGRIAAHLGFRLRRWEWWLVLIVAQMGTFLAWSFPPRYFAYNEVTALLAQAGALAIAALTARTRGRSLIVRSDVRAAAWAATGLIGALLFITKFTSGVAFSVVLLAALVIGDGVLAWAKRFAFTALGAVTAGLMLLSSGFPVRQFAASIKHLLVDRGAQAASGHSPRVLMTTYQQSLSDGIQAVVVPVALFALLLGLLFAVVTRVSRLAAMIPGAVLVTGGLAVLSVTTLPRIDTFPSLGRFILLMAAMTAVALVFSATHGPRRSGRRRFRATHVVGVGALIAAPFVSAAGTNMYITGQLLYAATLWCTLFGIALVFASRRLAHLGSPFAAIPIAFLTLFVAISATQVAGENFNHPYRSTPYLDQGTGTRAPFLQGILVTEDEAAWANWLVDQSVNLDASDKPTVSIAAPGALLIFNNSDYAGPWLDEFWPISFGTIGMACDGKAPESLLILQPDTSGEDTANFVLFHSALANDCGVEFPDDFDLVAKHDSTNPQYAMSIWRLRG